MVVETFQYKPDSKTKPDRKERRIRRILKDIEYPGIEAILCRCDGEGGGCQFFLKLRMRDIPDADKPGKELKQLQYYSLAVNGDESPEDLVRGIFENVQQFVLHEVAEHFKYQGRKVYNPHTPLAQSVRATAS